MGLHRLFPPPTFPNVKVGREEGDGGESLERNLSTGCHWTFREGGEWKISLPPAHFPFILFRLTHRKVSSRFFKGGEEGERL